MRESCFMIETKIDQCDFSKFIGFHLVQVCFRENELILVFDDAIITIFDEVVIYSWDNKITNFAVYVDDNRKKEIPENVLDLLYFPSHVVSEIHFSLHGELKISFDIGSIVILNNDPEESFMIDLDGKFYISRKKS